MCPLHFGQAKMVLVVVWLFNHFALKSAPSVNCIWIITFVGHLHVCVTKPKPSLMSFQLPVLTSNNVVWVNFSAVLFDETQHVNKTSTAGYVPVCYEIVNLFIELQNFLLIGLTFFLICKLKGFYLIVTVAKCCIFFFVTKLFSRPNSLNGSASSLLHLDKKQ